MQKSQDYCSLLRLCASRSPVISTASARLSRVAMSSSISPQSRISRRLAPGGPASHDRPRNAVSPFATAKIVVWPATCSVRGGLIIAARSRDACGDATLCAYGRRGERTGNRCDRDEGSKCLLHSRTLQCCLACGRATAAPPKTPRNSRRCMSIPSGPSYQVN